MLGRSKGGSNGSQVLSGKSRHCRDKDPILAPCGVHGKMDLSIYSGVDNTRSNWRRMFCSDGFNIHPIELG